MKKILSLATFLALSASLALSAEPKEWLLKGKSIDTYEYDANKPHSPAAFSSIPSKGLSKNQQKGQKIYAKWCLACHGEGMPGTNALAILYKDSDTPALLEDRTDLSADLVEIFVRFGKHSMPFFRKTEISDEELKYLGDYLSRNVK